MFFSKLGKESAAQPVRGAAAWESLSEGQLNQGIEFGSLGFHATERDPELGHRQNAASVLKSKIRKAVPK